MMGPALIDLYSSNYKESTSRKSTGTNDGNGNLGSIIKNKKPTIVKEKKAIGLRGLLFDNSSSQKNSNESNYHTLSGYTNGELLVNISEEEEKAANDETELTNEKKLNHKLDSNRRNNSEFYKSSSDGCKIKPLLSPISSSNSVQLFGKNNEFKPNVSETHQIDFGKVIARFPMVYVGQKFLDKKYTLPMMPWLVAEYRREVLPVGSSSSSYDSSSSFNSNSSSSSNFSLMIHAPSRKERKKIWFEITDRCILGYDRQQSGFEQLNKSFTADNEKEAFSKMNALNEGYIFLHKSNWICKIQSQLHEEGDKFSFAYLTRDFGPNFGQNNENKPYTLHVFECDDQQIMTDSIEIIKSVNPELLRSEELGMSSADSLLPKNSSDQQISGYTVDNILANSQQYEVMYSGKVRLAQKRALPSFIDDTIDAWKEQKTKQTKTNEQEKFQIERANIPTLSIEQTNKDDNKLHEINVLNEDISINRKLSICKGEFLNNNLLPKTSRLADGIEQQTYQNKNHLHLPSNHSLITNTQSLDESTRESILSDLKEVKEDRKQEDKKQTSDFKLDLQLSPKQKAQKINQNLNTIDDHLLTDNLNDLGEIKRSSSAKSSSSGHTSKLNSAKLQMHTRLRSSSGDTRMNKQISLPLYGRPRTGSGGSTEFSRRYNNSILQLRAQNRTMLFLIGRFEICLLSLDNQQILLNKSFNSVTHCSQGSTNPDHFGFICKEPAKNLSSTIYSSYRQLGGSNSHLNTSNSSSSSCLDTIEFDRQNDQKTISSASTKLKNDLTTDQDAYNYVGYIFRGENEKLVNEIMYSLKQAFRNAHQTIQKSKFKNNVFCSECPLSSFNKLCLALENVSVEKAQCIILTKIGELSSSEYKEIMSGYEGVQVNSIKEQNEILMSLLKRFYEKKQIKHPICLTEITNNPNTSSALDNFRQKAKKSLSTSFETILKLRHTDSNTEHLSESLTKLSKELRVQEQEANLNISVNDTTRSTSNRNLHFAEGNNENDDQPRRRRSSTISGSKDVHREMSFDQDNKNITDKSLLKSTSNRAIDQKRRNQIHSSSFTSSRTGNRESNLMNNKSESLPPKSPLFNIFMKIGNQNKSSDENLGNSSSSSSSNLAPNITVNNLNCSTNNSNNQSRNNSIDKENNFNNQQSVDQKNPSSILKQPNKQNLKQRSLEKTIEFSTSVTSFSDSNKQETKVLNKDDRDEEKDVLYDENGIPYKIEEDSEEFEENNISWRKQIFSSIQTNTCHLSSYNNEMKGTSKSVTFDSSNDLFKSGTRKRTREELRELWRQAIYQQIVLIKMEKENLLLQANQHEAEDKRLKLNYEDVIICKNTEQWTEILARCEEYAQKISNDELVGNFDCFGNTQNFNLTKYSSFLNSAVTPIEFAEALKIGCPKNRRGEIWCLLADIRQRNGVKPVCSPSEASCDFDTNYRVLLQQLTSQQHAILVDLGRTFPKHPYFAQSLGSGQLCLFNLLKAYSLFDKEVAYCQGLSFVAGILLIHMPEDDAFEMMKHLLFFLGLRKQYKPDMCALQMEFYQLTRLLYDHHRDLYDLFEKYNISPVLYAAPWFLTLFASQFSISFVSRLFDFIFLFGLEAIFRVSLSLLAIHKQSLLNCNSFESIIYFLKNDLVKTEKNQLESLFNIAFALDITRQLLVYEIEYQVIQEEMQYQPLTITYDRLKTVKEQSSLENESPNDRQNTTKLANLSTTHLKANQSKIRKISCSAIQQPQSPYSHLKQRKISSSVAVGTDAGNRIDFLTDTQSTEKIKELEKENKNLKNRNMEILDQLHVAQSSVYSLESSLESYKSTVKLLERRVRALEDERDALLNIVVK